MQKKPPVNLTGCIERFFQTSVFLWLEALSKFFAFFCSWPVQRFFLCQIILQVEELKQHIPIYFQSSLLASLAMKTHARDRSRTSFEIVSCLLFVIVTWKMLPFLSSQGYLNWPLQVTSRIRVSHQLISSLVKTMCIFPAERQHTSLMLHLSILNLNEKQISKMIDLASMKFMILFMGSNLEFLTYILRKSTSPLFL